MTDHPEQPPGPPGRPPGPPGQPPGPPGRPPPSQSYQAAYYVPPDHPQATTTLVLGILGLVVCGVLAPFAWHMGNRVLREIDQAQGRLGGRGNANAGRIMGIIGTALLVVGFVIVLVVGLILGLVTLSSSS